jgi:hypothetical protein
MKQFLITASLVFISQLTIAQNIDNIKADSKNFIWGEGRGTSLNRADQEALQQIISQISAQVESSFTILQEEVSKAGKTNFSQEARLMMTTYSNATLHNTERIVLNNEPDARVFRYIRRSDISKVFEQRKRKIIDFVSSAENFADRGQVADALKYYYWALALLRGHPEGSTIEFPDSKGQNKLLVGYLPQRINDVLASIKFEVNDIKDDKGERVVVLNITSNGKPAINFEYTYWDGRDWSAPVGAKDGVGYLEFFGESAASRSETQIKAEYVFEAEARIDRELEDVMKQLEPIPFRTAYFNLKLEKSQTVASVSKPVSTQTATTTSSTQTSSGTQTRLATIDIGKVSNPKPYEDNVGKVVAAIQSRNLASAKPLFTSEGYEIFNNLMGYGQSRVLSNDGYKTIRFGETVICRGPKMTFAFGNNTRRFVEDVVFYFDKAGKISTMAFGLEEEALASILGNTKWSEAERLTIVTFLEHYKTAYALKRIDYIRSIFADDALIIVGNVVKVKVSGDRPFQDNKIVRYNRYNKEQYLKNLEHCFARNEFINIKFEESDLRKAGATGGRFGIQIKQNYHSTNYGDQGYLFLLVDLENPDEPTIHVRTWQPEKNPDGSIYGLEDF